MWTFEEFCEAVFTLMVLAIIVVMIYFPWHR